MLKVIEKIVEDAGGIEEFRKQENKSIEEQKKRFGEEYDELMYSMPITIDTDKMSTQEIAKIAMDEISKYRQFIILNQVNTLILSNMGLNNFITCYLLDEVEDEGESINGIIIRVFEKYLRVKELLAKYGTDYKCELLIQYLNELFEE